MAPPCSARTTGTTPPSSNRVVRVIDSAATTWNGAIPTDFYQYTVGSVVDAMFEDGLTALTNTASLQAAWESLVPYNSGELVVIHINAYINTDNSRKNNVCEPISALVYGLVDLLGIPPGQIAITDPSRTLLGSPAQARIIDNCRYTDQLAWDLYEGQYASAIPFTAGHAPPSSENLARAVEMADHLIMVPVLSWHGFNWITGCMKMMMGSISDMADICMPVRDKVRLIVADGLYGNIDGNSNPPHIFQTLGGAGTHPSSTLYFSRDMVATDSVMYDDLLDEARAQSRPKSGFGYGFLAYAADANHQLGTFEMREDTGNSGYNLIDLVEINRS